MEINPPQLDRKDSHGLLMATIVLGPIAFIHLWKGWINELCPLQLFCPSWLEASARLLEYRSEKRWQKKDTLRNIESSRDFVVNVVDEPFAEAMNQSFPGYPSDVEEFREIGLIPVKSDLVKSPMVVESPVNMECEGLLL